MKDVILIDNFTVCFALQVDNGFPMLPYYNRKDDKEMIYLYYFLKRIHSEPDLRSKLVDTFWLQKLRIPEVCDSISGVIEYIIEEVSDSPDRSKLASPMNNRRQSKMIKVSNPLTPLKDGIDGGKDSEVLYTNYNKANNTIRMNIDQIVPKVGDKCLNIPIDETFEI
jgi:hypothetical protein